MSELNVNISFEKKKTIFFSVVSVTKKETEHLRNYVNICMVIGV